MKLLKLSKITTLAIGSISLSACFFGGDDKPGNPVPNPSTALYEIPATLVTDASSTSQEMNTAAKEEEQSLFDAYKPVPVYITMAENARSVVAEILTDLHSQDLPRSLQTEEDGISLSIAALDSIDTKWSEIKWSDSKTGVAVNVVTRKSTAAIGHVILENEAEGQFIRMDFSNENESKEGRKLRVEFRNSLEELAQATDPRVIVVNASKKGEKVYISGKSFSPEFKDPEGFWYKGLTVPSIYAFQAYSEEAKAQAVLKAAFGPSGKDGDNFLEEYALDQHLLEQLRDNLIKEIEEDQNILKAFYWSIETESPIEPGSNPALALYETRKTSEDITLEELEEFAAIQTNAEDANPSYAEIVLYSNAKQPIYLSVGASIEGNSELLSGDKIMVDAAELEFTPEFEAIDF